MSGHRNSEHKTAGRDPAGKTSLNKEAHPERMITAAEPITVNTGLPFFHQSTTIEMLNKAKVFLSP